MHMLSVMVVARTSSAPRKMPGNPSELFTWFSKSDRPLANTYAPASLASHGQISGTGFAQAKTTGFEPIAFTYSCLMSPAPA